MAIRNCTCKHAYQDETYGPGRRVANPKPKTTGRPQEYTCTVCCATISDKPPAVKKIEEPKKK